MTPPEQEDDCLFCNRDMQQIILSDLAYIKKALSRYIIYAAFCGGILVGLGILTIQNINLEGVKLAAATVAAVLNGRY